MKIVGHRGARRLAPENTLKAIEKALQAGADEIEIDVRVTKDGHVILHHDPVMHLPAGNFATAAHTLEELQHHKPDITTLAEAIRTIDRKAPLMIEVKPKEPIEPIVAVVERFLSGGWEPTDFMFGSFSQKALRNLHEVLPQVPRVVIEAFSGMRAMARARDVDSNKISLNHHFLWFATIANMRKRRYEIYAWSLNNPAKAKRWARFGLAGAITDDPSLYKK